MATIPQWLLKVMAILAIKSIAIVKSMKCDNVHI